MTLDNPEGFSLTAGVIIAVTFNAGNDVASPKLNVAGTGEKSVNFHVAGGLYSLSSLPYYRWGTGVIFFKYTANGWAISAADMGIAKYLVDNKADLASPALTGTPTAPTAPTGTDTTQLATTAFVQQEIADHGGASTLTPVVTNGNLTFTLS